MENQFTNGVYIQPLAMFEVVVHPALTELVGAGTGALDAVTQDFIVLSDVPNKRPIIDIFPLFNLLNRDDTSCQLVYKRIANTGLRYVTTDEVYGATQNCAHEFYQGALKDFGNNKEVFTEKITPFFLKAVRTDVGSNAWFGDTTRTAIAGGVFSVTIFDGIWKWIQTYTGNLIPSAQIFSPATTDYRQPAHYVDAFNAIDAAWQLQPDLLRAYPDDSKVIYCDKATHDGFSNYMKILGTETDTIVSWLMGDNRKFDAYQGIPIMVVPLWEPMLNIDNSIYTQVAGTKHHAVLLTMQKNFIFATDSKYGRGPNEDQALNIWYRQIDMSWYWQMFLRTGTQIMVPEFIVAGMA